MGFAGIELRPSTAMTFSIALGIAVDDTIHFLSRFRSEYSKRLQEKQEKKLRLNDFDFVDKFLFLNVLCKMFALLTKNIFIINIFLVYF